MKKYSLFLLGTIFMSLLTVPFFIANNNEYWYVGIIAGVIFGYFIMILSDYFKSFISSNKELDDKITNIISKLQDFNDSNIKIIDSQNTIKNDVIKTLSEEFANVHESAENATQQLLAQKKEIATLIQLLNSKTDVISENVVKVFDRVNSVISKTEDTNVVLNKITENNKKYNEVLTNDLNNAFNSLSKNVENNLNKLSEKQHNIIYDSTNRLCNIINQYNHEFKDTVVNLSGKINTSINGVSEHLEGIDKLVKIHQEKMDTLDTEIKSSYKILEHYRNESEKLLENINMITIDLKGLNDKFNKTITEINGYISSSIKKQDDVIEELNQGSREVNRTISNSIESFNSNIDFGIKSLKDSIKESLNMLVDQVEELSTTQEISYENIKSITDYIKDLFADKKLDEKERELISKLEAACKKH